ncbi:MAG: D-alanine--D-alanine ligase family protein [Desulfovibrio sp.]
MRILLIAGGWSSERAVSLSGAENIQQALSDANHDVTFCDLSIHFAQLPELAAQHDFAFINLHGAPGEDGLVQAMLEKSNCPYQGSGPEASFLALDKAASKIIFAQHKITTPAWELVPVLPETGRAIRLELPVFIKPNSGGSSVGMSLVRTEEEIIPALQKVFDLGGIALVEELVEGDELTCAILGETPLPLIQIKPKADADFFDYENKYAEDGAEEICPAPVEKTLWDTIQKETLAAHKALGLAGYSRADFIVRDGIPYMLEINTLPGMTSTSLVPQAANEAGFDFTALLEELIALGLKKHTTKQTCSS